MFSNKTKTARKGGWSTLFGVICYNHCGHCYIRWSDPLFLSRSPRQEGGGASAEESISAFCMCGHCTVHFLYKSYDQISSPNILSAFNWCCYHIPVKSITIYTWKFKRKISIYYEFTIFEPCMTKTTRTQFRVVFSYLLYSNLLSGNTITGQLSSCFSWIHACTVCNSETISSWPSICIFASNAYSSKLDIITSIGCFPSI